MFLTPLHKLPKNVGDFGKLIVATGFEWLPKVQKIAQSGHTDWRQQMLLMTTARILNIIVSLFCNEMSFDLACESHTPSLQEVGS